MTREYGETGNAQGVTGLRMIWLKLLDHADPSKSPPSWFSVAATAVSPASSAQGVAHVHQPWWFSKDLSGSVPSDVGINDTATSAT